MHASSTFGVLIVCTGNLCRSPLAEDLLTRRFAALPSVTVTSRGVRAATGSAVPPSMELAGAGVGSDLSGHRSQPLTAADVDGADLILGLAREHRRAIALLSPRASRRTFTLIEFRRLTEGVTTPPVTSDAVCETRGARELREAVLTATARRGHIRPPRDPSELDVVDPYRLADSVYRTCANSIAEACDPIADYLISAMT